jgi:hypothetical protein
MPFRVSIFFAQQSDLSSGWSENFWNTSADLSAVKTVGNTLALALNTFHGNQSILTTMRISDPSKFRLVDITRYALAGTAPSRGNLSSDFPNTAGLLVLTGAGNYVTRQWIRGLPDGDIAFAGRWSPISGSVTAFGTVRGLLLSGSNGWALRRQDRTVPKKVIQAITQAGVVTVSTHGYNTNDRIRISRCKGTFAVNKVWQIVVIDANTFSLIGFVQPVIPAVYLGNGTSQLQSAVYVGITDAKIDRATSHKTGRPFGLASGRRRVRKT